MVLPTLPHWKIELIGWFQPIEKGIFNESGAIAMADIMIEHNSVQREIRFHSGAKVLRSGSITLKFIQGVVHQARVLVE